MKTSFLCLLAALAILLCGNAWAQTPEPAVSPAVSPAVTTPAVTNPAVTPVPTVAMTPAATVAVAPTIAPTATVARSPKDEDEDDIDAAIEKKIRKHFNIDIDSHRHVVDESDVPWIAVPIVFIVFLTIFGVPVAIVGLIMYFSFSKSRAMHKTVRMMVEKGQPVPESLLNPPPVVRQRSDLRRGIVLLMVGAGLMVFFAACNDWEGGSWSIGIIPFMIGVGYLLVWRLGAHKEDKSVDSSPKV
jgi:Domain of unknown function (DUF6249)